MVKVAVIEDETEIRELREIAIGLAGFEVVSAGDGKRGLDTIFRERPRVAILDVMMPGMSGFAVCHSVDESKAAESL